MAERQTSKARVVQSDEASITIDNRDYGTLFADGIAEIGIGGAVSKILFFKIIASQPKDGKPYERREVNYEVVVPTAVFFGWLSQLSSQMNTFIPEIDKAAEQTKASIRQMAGQK